MFVFYIVLRKVKVVPIFELYVMLEQNKRSTLNVTTVVVSKFCLTLLEDNTQSRMYME